MNPQWIPGAPAVLVADDDPAVRRLTARMLTNAGYNVRLAMDARQASEQIRLGVSAALVDMLFVNSAGMSGLDILRDIRSLPHLEKIPVLVLTGFALNSAVLAEVRSLEAEMWLKPFEPADVVKRLEVLLGRQGAPLTAPLG